MGTYKRYDSRISAWSNKIAQERRNIEKPVIIHSDRGIQFTSELYKEITEKWNEAIQKSMSMGQCMYRIVSFINKEGVVKPVQNPKLWWCI